MGLPNYTRKGKPYDPNVSRINLSLRKNVTQNFLTLKKIDLSLQLSGTS